MRGMKFIKSAGIHTEDDDDIIATVLAREVSILRERGLQEIRETHVSSDYHDSAVMGSPVSVRLMIPQLSILPCVNNSFRQIAHMRKVAGIHSTDSVSLTPECHILLSKACEQMIVEVTSRALLDASRSKTSDVMNHVNIIRSLPVWDVEDCPNRKRNDFAFANDVIDRFSDKPANPFDILSSLHR
jgi:hypothetical protein